jgi:hypothetical protein
MDLAIVRSINQAEVDVLIDMTSLDYGLVYTVFLSAPLQDDYGFHPIASVYVRFQANALLVYTF